MPKKRHLSKYSKPQSTPPALLSSTGTRRNDSHHDDSSHGRGVNELLASLRRTGLSGSGQQVADVVRPTVPPTIRQILQIPETPPPRPRRPARVGRAGTRLPAGPAPPRSWLSGPERAGNALRRSALGYGAAGSYEQQSLPGANLPARGSLADMVLRRMVLDWEWQKEYCQYHLYELPTKLRVALVVYLVTYTREGVSLQDLQAILLPPRDVPEYQEDPSLAPSVVNEYFHYLDLSGSVGRSLKLRELSDFLFPPQPKSIELQESWEDATEQSPAGVPRPLLPNLTHLSLALSPTTSSSSSPPHGGAAATPTTVSWRHLLALAANLPGLTHLSLAFWPEPSLTPNARLATVVSPQTGRTVPYGGTGPYSHSLEDDWAEQVLILRRLSRSLYGLEYLDFTGCGEWFPALWASAGEGDTVDWSGAWGKVETLVMFPGYRLREDADAAETARYWEYVDWARRVERHVRSRRAGKGRFITVETSRRPEEIGG
ncbi:uncharacterized protein P884DRAFT_260303 [Thermothelomyces heterothallicus CBS 202.75]|uniref:uncharacterized protein n=1 Tax=Thermothelomyces heterothallicus CBS 202.75 TaxID=1149848 RepID=UPI003742ED25